MPRRSQPPNSRPDREPVRSGGRSHRAVERNADEEALALRESGKTFAAIARSVGFNRANEAHGAFLRALRKREGDDRAGLVQREAGRLDELETRIRTRDAGDQVRMDRRLTALAKMREVLGGQHL
jgi:electron transfer flavoprotein alpha/beta subunit